MQKKQQAQLSLGGVILVVAFVAAQQFFGIDLLGDDQSHELPHSRQLQAAPAPSNVASPTRVSDDAIRQLIDHEISGEMVTVEVGVLKVLADDSEGSRHQRLLLALQSGGTVLVSHNIDLAPRVPAEEGDIITVRGQYEFNDKGGVIHWTHHDPKDWREGGWIELDGERYE